MCIYVFSLYEQRSRVRNANRSPIWQGSVHDSAVFNSSMLQAHLEAGGGRDGWLLGDRGTR